LALGFDAGERPLAFDFQFVFVKGNFDPGVLRAEVAFLVVQFKR
jgi:hypothetical protein